MYCMTCGKHVPQEAKFCLHCGAAVPLTTASPETANVRQSRNGPAQLRILFRYFLEEDKATWQHRLNNRPAWTIPSPIMRHLDMDRQGECGPGSPPDETSAPL